MAETRVALVIGNAAYHHAPPLANPGHDARGVATALRRLQFQVEEGIDLDTTGMRLALRKFAANLEDADVGLFFYAGHALQVRGKNYLTPIDAKLEKESDLLFEGVDLELVLRLLEERPRTSLVFLDACRDNPLGRGLARSMDRTRSQMIGQGLAGIESGIGTLIAYATQPDSVALDGTGRNSPFTGALLENIETSGIEIRQMLSRVRRAVIDTTQRRQVPWDHSSLTGDFYFQPAALEAAETAPAPAAAEATSPSGSDVVVWSVIQGSANATDFEIFLEKYPQSPFAAFAQGRLATLAPQPESSGPSALPESRADAAQGASAGQQAIDAGADQVAATERQAVSGPPEPRGEETAAGEPADAALAALSEQSPSSGPHSEAAPVDTPTAPPSEPEQRDVAALTGKPPSDEAAPLPGSAEQARAVEQALDLSRDDWREVQRALNRLNHAAGPEDGLPGRQTRGALEAWQQAVGSAPTGHLTAAQHARLLEEAAPEVAAVASGPIPVAEAAPEVAAVAPGPIPAAEAAPEVAAVIPGPIRSAEGEPIDQCDRLAGQPSDPSHVGAGVEWQHLQPEPALVACALAMQEHSDEVRYQYQYGRALLRVGLVDDARLWFRSTAEQGYVAAQRNVGHMYMLGVGVPRDEGEAASWYRRAAEQSDSRSQYLLGLMYAVGLGVPRDNAQAATWLRRAAEQEEEGAQFILGWMYKHGRGVPRDLAQATAWYSEAAAQGNQVASAALQRLP